MLGVQSPGEVISARKLFFRIYRMVRFTWTIYLIGTSVSIYSSVQSSTNAIRSVDWSVAKYLAVLRLKAVRGQMLLQPESAVVAVRLGLPDPIVLIFTSSVC